MHIAKRPIKVKKIFIQSTYNENKLHTPVWYCEINLDCTNCMISNTIKPFDAQSSKRYWFVIKKKYYIEEGIHSYSAKNQIEFEFNEQGLDRAIVYKNTKAVVSHDLLYGLPCKKPVVMECIIPTGTKYYYNDIGHYVSEKLIIVKQI